MLLSAVWLLGACAPALDWREVQMEGSGVRAVFPCKPAQEVRRVALAGAQVSMTMRVCSAAGMRFALAEADMEDPARVGPALEQLAQAQARNLDTPLPAGRVASIPGMTPQPAALELSLQGHHPDGSAVAARLVVFAKGTRVLQATVLGNRIEPGAVRSFMEALRFQS